MHRNNKNHSRSVRILAMTLGLAAWFGHARWAEASAPVTADSATPAKATSPSGQPVSADSGPRIKFAEPIHDFGRVPYGKIFTNNFIFANTGDQLLEIRDIIS